MDLAVDSPSEVNAEERELRVWHWVDERSHKVGPGRRELVVLAPKGHDLQSSGGPGTTDRSCDRIGVQATTRDDIPGGDGVSRRLEHHALGAVAPRQDRRFEAGRAM